MSRRRLTPLLAAVAAGALMLLLGGTASSFGPTATSTWVVSGGTAQGGIVASVAVAGSTAYLGGNFDYVGPETGSFVAVDTTTSGVAPSWPTVGGNVYAVASDGSGGYFIGGFFGSIGTKHSDNIAHIKSDGTLDTAWSGSTNGTVYAIQVSGTTVFAGGAFTQAGGATHANLAAFNTTSGAVVGSFNPNATGTGAFVAALRLSGSALYVGGLFSTLGDQTRTNIGAVSTAGAVQAWAPTTNGIVYALAVGGSGTVYAGGAFTAVTGNTERFYGAAFNGTSGAVTNWEPEPDGQIFALEVSGSTVYAGGAFTEIGSTPDARSGLAAVTANTGDLTNWNPHLAGEVYAISAPGDGSTVYVGGAFTGVNNSVARDNVAAIAAAAPGNATSFWTVVGGPVDALAVSGSTIGLGGEFRTAGGGAGNTPTPLHRSNLAAIDLTTGMATTWNPRTNDGVEVVAVAGSRVYAGGEFTTVNGNVARDRLAAFDTNLGTATPWNPGVHNGGVLALAVSGSTVYVGGSFHGATAVSNPAVAKNRLAAFRADGVGNGLGDLLAWDPNASVANAVDDGAVFALDVVGSLVYVGGSFNRLRNTVVRNHLAAVASDPSGSGTPTAWDPNVSDSVFTLAHAGTTEYAGGPFAQVNGNVLRPGAAAFDAATATATAWNPQLLRNGATSGSVYALAPSGSTMYVSGIFRTVGGLWTGGSCVAPCFLSPEVTAVSLTTGAPNTSWAPGANDLVASVALSQQGLVLGGSFTALGFPPGGTTPVNPDEPAASYQGSVGLVRALPDAPTAVSATAGDGTATVTFQPPAYTGGATITSYTLRDDSHAILMNGVTSPVTVPGLVNGTTYTFSVTATSSAGTGEPAVSNAVKPHTVPGAPSIYATVAGDTQATVSFSPPASNGGDPVSSYTVTSSPGNATATGTSSPIVVTGLTNGATYTFTVTAANSAGAGPASAASSPVIPHPGGRPQPPDPPPPGPRPAVPDVPPGLPPRIPPPGS